VKITIFIFLIKRTLKSYGRVNTNIHFLIALFLKHLLLITQSIIDNISYVRRLFRKQIYTRVALTGQTGGKYTIRYRALIDLVWPDNEYGSITRP